MMTFAASYTRRWLRLFAAVTAVISIAVASTALAQAGAESESTALNYSLVDLIQFGGWVGYVIIFLSVIAVALVIEYALSIRAKTVMPEAERASIASLIDESKFDEIVALGDGTPSFLSGVVASGIKERDRGFDAMVKAMEDTADGYTGRMLRRIEHLNIIANIAPMLGLLGTVMGMVNSFNQISIAVGGVDPRRLAGGIFEALMTTVMGLIVAIPALWMFGIFRNRVDGIVHDATLVAEALVEPFKPRDLVPAPAPAAITTAAPVDPPSPPPATEPTPNTAATPATAVKTQSGSNKRNKKQKASEAKSVTQAEAVATVAAEPLAATSAPETSATEPAAAEPPQPAEQPAASGPPPTWSVQSEPAATPTDSVEQPSKAGDENAASDEATGDGWSLEALAAELTPDEEAPTETEDSAWSLESLISETTVEEEDESTKSASEWTASLFEGDEDDGRSLLERLDAEADAGGDKKDESGGGKST